MIRDFYIKKESDPNYDPNVLEINSPEEELITQTRMVIGTTKNSLIGEPDFGLNQLDYLFKYDINTNYLENEMNEQLMKYSHLAYQLNTHIEVSNIKTVDGKKAILSNIYVDNKKAFGLLL